MARLCRSFQAYLGFPCVSSEQQSEEFIFSVNSRSEESVDQKENENNYGEGKGKKSEKLGDLLCEPANWSFESLMESTLVSNAGPYGTEQQNSNHNSCTNDGLRSCTESLGFESSDESEDRSSYVDIVESSSETEFENGNKENDCKKELNAVGGRAMKDGGNGIRRDFPPPLSSMGPNGQPSVFLKPLRKDGRFLLQEVKLPRHEYMHAWRQNGRLRLQLVLPSRQPSPPRDDVIGRADECAKVGDTCASSPCDTETWDASLEQERAHVECFRRGDASLALYQEGLGRRCHNNTKCMTSTWKPRCIST